MAPTDDRVTLYSAIDPYPQPRGNRSPALSEAEAGALTLKVPQVSHQAFHVCTTLANRRSLLATRRFVGEVLLDEIVFSFGTSTRTSPPCQFLVYYNGTQYVTEENVTFTAGIAGQPIFEYGQVEPSVAQPPFHVGTDHMWAGNATTPHTYKLRRPIRQSEVFLAIAVIGRAAGAIQVHGVIRILENVDPQTMGELLLT